jgi:hypothetical protein
MGRLAKNEVAVDMTQRTVTVTMNGVSRKDKSTYSKTVTFDFNDVPIEVLLRWASKDVIRKVQNRLNLMSEDDIETYYTEPVNVQQTFVEDWHEVERMIKKHGITVEKLRQLLGS